MSRQVERIKVGKTDLELVTDIEEQAVLLPWPQVVHRGLDTRVSTEASEGQVCTVGPRGSETVQVSVNVVDVEEGDIEGLVITVTAPLGLESVKLDAVVSSDHGGVGGGYEEKERSELHGGPGARRRAGAEEEKKAKLGDINPHP